MTGSVSEQVAAVRSRYVPAAVATGVVWVGVVLVLAAVLVGQATSAGVLFEGWQLATATVVLAVAAVTRQFLFESDPGDEREAAYLGFLVAAAIALAVLSRSSTPGVGLGLHRPTELFLLFLVVLVLLVSYPGPDTLTPSQWLFVGGFAVVAGLYLFHSLAAPPAARAARWPLWAVVAAGCSLVLLPRFVSRRAFLWALAGLSAVVAALGLLTLVVGEYSVSGFAVQVIHDANRFSERTGLPRVQSIYRNPNALGLVTFAGATAAVVELHRAVRRQRWITAALALGLLGTSALGLLFSHSRASWLAAATAIGLYLGYVALGRERVPHVTAAGGLAVAAAIAAVFWGFGSIDPAGRFQLWRATLRAFLADPTLFGEGHVSTSGYIEPYLDRDSPNTPHNSYLSMLVRTGLVGALAYVGLVAGAIADGVRRRATVDLGLLALAAGWAVHQLFEAYTVFQWTPPAVFAALALGYVVFGAEGDGEPCRAEDGQSAADATQSATDATQSGS